MFNHTYMKSKYFVEKSQQKLPLPGFGRRFPPCLVSHDAHIAPSSTLENRSPKTAPGVLKFYEIGSYITPA